MGKYIMSLDAGTTSNRCILFDHSGKVCSMAQKEFTQYFPKPGWVEHDANEIWSTQLGVAVEAMHKINAKASDIAAIGITNQRETAIVWNKNTGEPIYHAIVWQCRRTADLADSLKEKGLQEEYQKKKQDASERRREAAYRRKVRSEIEKLEKELEDINDELFGEAATDYMRAAELDARREAVEERLMELYEEEEKFEE